MNDHDIQGPPVEAARARLLDLARETIRRRHYSYRTEQAYLHWMKPVNIHEAKTRLSKLVERAEAGEEVVIARAGKPAAKLVPLAKTRGRRRLGLLDGKFRIPEDFNAPLPELVLRAFEGEK